MRPFVALLYVAVSSASASAERGAFLARLAGALAAAAGAASAAYQLCQPLQRAPRQQRALDRFAGVLVVEETPQGVCLLAGRHRPSCRSRPRRRRPLRRYSRHQRTCSTPVSASILLPRLHELSRGPLPRSCRGARGRAAAPSGRAGRGWPGPRGCGRPRASTQDVGVLERRSWSTSASTASDCSLLVAASSAALLDVVADALLQRLHGLEAFADALGERVVQVGQLLFLNLVRP